ncbi:hypothetical protein BX285_0480 [Streptomyces sp. 1114.5]|uniref:hypothetical protein n=1 Tax=Streptomyces sp. 1114.5 TaxID=1938830 RepID=UPI000EB3450B|nr:hypothetical protein [Streptomyces sp. 1114.5]RKT16155.1 hypothetical protein BX285_0480 [Streptomyces sp. 1114.5]
MADTDDTHDSKAKAQVWGAAVVVASALAVVAAYLINGAPLVLVVAGVQTVLLMVYVGRRWRAQHGRPTRSGHRPRRGIPDAAHCERCRRAREALDARQARPDSAPQSEPGAGDRSPYPRRPQVRAPYERPWTAERAAARSVDRSTARRGAPGSAGRAVRHQ